MAEAVRDVLSLRYDLILHCYAQGPAFGQSDKEFLEAHGFNTLMRTGMAEEVITGDSVFFGSYMEKETTSGIMSRTPPRIYIGTMIP